MNAALQNTGRSEVQERREGMAERGSTPAVRAKFHIFKGQDDRTPAERRRDLDAEAVRLNVSRMCFV